MTYLLSLLLLLIVIFAPDTEQKPQYIPKSQRETPSFVDKCINIVQPMLIRACNQLEAVTYKYMSTRSKKQQRITSLRYRFTYRQK
jgi:hypothetical protein